MAKQKEDALEKVAPAYLLQQDDIVNVMEALAENIGSEGLTRFDFPRVKAPSGEGKFLEIATEENPDGEPVTSISGIIVGNHMARSYWKSDVGASGVSNAPPDCASNDAVRGVGDPGGDCEECPLSKFKTDRGGEGRGQACKQMRVIYLLTPGSALPTVINMPPTSLKAAREYLLGLSRFGRPQYTVETEIGIKPMKNPDGKPFNQFTFKKVRNIEGDDLVNAKKYAHMLQDLLNNNRPAFPEVPEA